MGSLRLWHPAHDAYHCAFRMLRLLSAGKSMPSEKLYILDFFLLFPFLLHDCKYTSEIRGELKTLDIVKPENQFLNIPSPQVLYRDLRIYQKTATVHLAAKGIIDPNVMTDSFVTLRSDAIPGSLRDRIDNKNSTDASLVKFLVHRLGTLELAGKDNLYQCTKLPRRIT